MAYNPLKYRNGTPVGLKVSDWRGLKAKADRIERLRQAKAGLISTFFAPLLNWLSSGGDRDVTSRYKHPLN